MQDWKSYAGWGPWPQQPGAEGARHRGILSLLVAHRLFRHPDQQRQLTTPLPAYTGGRRRATGPVECLVEGSDAVVASDDPQEKRQHCTNAFHEVCAFGSSKKHRSPRP